MPRPELHAVDSEAVGALGYDAERHELHVRFRGSHGTTYVYEDVSAREYADLLAADSIGAHLNKEIKPRHPFRQLDDSDDGDRARPC